jgi:hypothetical protein
MNVLWTRLFKSAYRKEPISSFIITVGVVDAAIGSVGERWSLFTLGLGLILIASVLRWWQVQKSQATLAEEAARTFLPPSESRPPLPSLTTKKQR